MKRQTKLPASNDRLGWHKFYAERFNKTGSWQAEQLSMWYLFLHLAFDTKYAETTEVGAVQPLLCLDWPLLAEQTETLSNLYQELVEQKRHVEAEHLTGVLNILNALEHN